MQERENRSHDVKGSYPFPLMSKGDKYSSKTFMTLGNDLLRRSKMDKQI